MSSEQYDPKAVVDARPATEDAKKRIKALLQKVHVAEAHLSKLHQEIALLNQSVAAKNGPIHDLLMRYDLAIFTTQTDNVVYFAQNGNVVYKVQGYLDADVFEAE